MELDLAVAMDAAVPMDTDMAVTNGNGYCLEAIAMGFTVVAKAKATAVDMTIAVDCGCSSVYCQDCGDKYCTCGLATRALDCSRG